MKRSISLFGCILGLFIATSAFSATLLVDGTGQLYGATDVLVDGLLYDVEFVDDTGENLFFDGTEWSFDFDNEASAIAASQALLEQVLIDIDGVGNFDSEPELMRGVESEIVESVLTPFSFSASFYSYAYMMNYADGTERLSSANANISAAYADLSSYPTGVYAVWSPSAEPVPEPATMLLLGTGFVGLAGARLRRKK